MAAFSFAAFAGTGFGPLFAGWIAMNPHLEWRWIQWLHLMYDYDPLALTHSCIESRHSQSYRNLSYPNIRVHEGDQGIHHSYAHCEEETRGDRG